MQRAKFAPLIGQLIWQKLVGTSPQVPICSDGPLDQRQLPEATDEIQGSLINRQNCSHDAARQKSSYGHTVLRYIKGIVICFHLNNFQRGLLKVCETEQKPRDEIQGLLINRQNCSHDAARQKSSYGHTVLRYIKGIVICFHMNNFQRGLLKVCETEQKPQMRSKDH